MAAIILLVSSLNIGLYLSANLYIAFAIFYALQTCFVIFAHFVVKSSMKHSHYFEYMRTLKQRMMFDIGAIISQVFFFAYLMIVYRSELQFER